MSDEISGFTPGPWTVAEERHSYDIVVRGADYGPVALVQIAGYTKPCGRANARLIAAAPDIYADNARLRADNERLGNIINTAGDDHDRLRRLNEGLVAALRVARELMDPSHVPAMMCVNAALRSATEKDEPT